MVVAVRQALDYKSLWKAFGVVFVSGVSGLLFVPLFKSITHFPPFMGMMLSLGFIWLLTDLLHRKDNKEAQRCCSRRGTRE